MVYRAHTIGEENIIYYPCLKGKHIKNIEVCIFYESKISVNLLLTTSCLFEGMG